MKQCIKCGFKLQDNAKFCIICGEKQIVKSDYQPEKNSYNEIIEDPDEITEALNYDAVKYSDVLFAEPEYLHEFCKRAEKNVTSEMKQEIYNHTLEKEKDNWESNVKLCMRKVLLKGKYSDEQEKLQQYKEAIEKLQKKKFSYAYTEDLLEQMIDQFPADDEFYNENLNSLSLKINKEKTSDEVDSFINQLPITVGDYNYIKSCKHGYVLRVIALNLIITIAVGSMLWFISLGFTTDKERNMMNGFGKLLSPLFLYGVLRSVRNHFQNVLKKQKMILRMQTYYALSCLPKYFMYVNLIYMGLVYCIGAVAAIQSNPTDTKLLTIISFYVAFSSIYLLIYFFDKIYYQTCYRSIFDNEIANSEANKNDEEKESVQ